MKKEVDTNIFSIDQGEEWGDEFDYWDEYPEDDPFTPKPTCTHCGGKGEVLTRDGMWTICTYCWGSGVES